MRGKTHCSRSGVGWWVGNLAARSERNRVVGLPMCHVLHSEPSRLSPKRGKWKGVGELGVTAEVELAPDLMLPSLIARCLVYIAQHCLCLPMLEGVSSDCLICGPAQTE